MEPQFKECVFTLIASPDKVETFKIASEEGVDNFVYPLILQFDNVDRQKGSLDMRQYANTDLKERVITFLNIYAVTIPPVRRLIAFFDRLPDNEPFIFLPFYEPDTVELGTYFNYLKV